MDKAGSWPKYLALLLHKSQISGFDRRKYMRRKTAPRYVWLWNRRSKARESFPRYIFISICNKFEVSFYSAQHCKNNMPWWEKQSSLAYRFSVKWKRLSNHVSVRPIVYSFVCLSVQNKSLANDAKMISKNKYPSISMFLIACTQSRDSVFHFVGRHACQFKQIRQVGLFVGSAIT